MSIHFRCEPELEEFCDTQGKKMGGNRSTFLRSLILEAKSREAMAGRPIMDDPDAARGSQIVSMAKLKLAKKSATPRRVKGGAR